MFKLEDLEKIQYNATIFAKDLKVGMRLMDEDDPDRPEPESFIFEVVEVKVSDEIVTYREVACGDNGKVIHDFAYDLFRKPEEPKITVFFSSIEEALKFGIKEKDIESKWDYSYGRK